jgi:hypothetical protein
MIIAREKRRTNIVEYILYMYQVEDTIRACEFNMDLIEQRVIAQFQVTEKVKQDIRNWYSDLMVIMYQEGVKDTGHISMLTSLSNDLYSLHYKLIHEIQDNKYLEQYAWAMPNIRAFESRIGKTPKHEIDTCLTAMYALLLLRLQKKKVSRETMEAMQTFSNLLALLGNWYRKMEEGKLEV